MRTIRSMSDITSSPVRNADSPSVQRELMHAPAARPRVRLVIRSLAQSVRARHAPTSNPGAARLSRIFRVPSMVMDWNVNSEDPRGRFLRGAVLRRSRAGTGKRRSVGNAARTDERHPAIAALSARATAAYLMPVAQQCERPAVPPTTAARHHDLIKETANVVAGGSSSSIAVPLLVLPECHGRISPGILIHPGCKVQV